MSCENLLQNLQTFSQLPDHIHGDLWKRVHLRMTTEPKKDYDLSDLCFHTIKACWVKYDRICSYLFHISTPQISMKKGWKHVNLKKENIPIFLMMEYVGISYKKTMYW